MAPLCVVLLAGACNQAGDVRDWTPKDHDGEAKAGQVDGVAAPGEEDAVVIAIAWKENCSRCHGMDGAGNTPEGRMVKASNLAQSKSSPEDMANTITKGRNKMPSFGQALSPKIIAGLVAHIKRIGRGPKK
jgi:cytochrome c oxidase cbb3-type subunit 3